MRKDEYGITFRMGAAWNMSGNTSLTINFTKPDNTTLSVASPNVVLGSTQYDAGRSGIFKANEYAEYTTQGGDIDQSGKWKAELIYQDTNKLLKSKQVEFTVDP